MKKFLTFCLIVCTLYFGYYYFTHRLDVKTQQATHESSDPIESEGSDVETEDQAELIAYDKLAYKLAQLELEVKREERQYEEISEKINFQKSLINKTAQERRQIEFTEKSKIERFYFIKKKDRETRITQAKEKIVELTKQIKHQKDAYKNALKRYDEHKAFYQENSLTFYFANAEKQREFEKEKKDSENRLVGNINSLGRRGAELIKSLSEYKNKLQQLAETPPPVMPDPSRFEERVNARSSIVTNKDQEQQLTLSIRDLEKNKLLSLAKIATLNAKIETIFNPANE